MPNKYWIDTITNFKKKKLTLYIQSYLIHLLLWITMTLQFTEANSNLGMPNVWVQLEFFCEGQAIIDKTDIRDSLCFY